MSKSFIIMKEFNVVKALIKFNDNYLIIKKLDFIGGEFEIPGGRKNLSENDGDALKREVKEEVGLNINIINLVHEWDLTINEKELHLLGKTYLCESKSDKVQLSEEHSEFQWVSLKKLKEKNIPKWLRESLNCL